MKTQGVGRKMHPQEVLLAIAPLISKERREKVELGKKRGPAERGPKTRPTLGATPKGGPTWPYRSPNPCSRGSPAVHYNNAEPQNCIVEKFCATGGQSQLSLLGIVEKTFLSTSNVIISQSVRSTFLKLFAHVLLVV
jgi:hypothetical protein